VHDLAPSPSVIMARHHEHRVLLQALRRIPMDHQIVLELYYWEDMTAAELAEVLEIPEGTVRGRIRRAKQLLEEQLSLLAENDVDLESTMSNLDSWAKSLRAKILPPET
jgi:DNA-directed RNA polymerase specialized sigma24 family protein